jgi:hypothetical protein
MWSCNTGKPSHPLQDVHIEIDFPERFVTAATAALLSAATFRAILLPTMMAETFSNSPFSEEPCRVKAADKADHAICD